MKGYIKNISSLPKYLFKNHLLPGDALDLKEVFSLYLLEGRQKDLTSFKEWLTPFVSDTNVWEVVFDDESSERKAAAQSEGTTTKKREASEVFKDVVSSPRKKTYTVEDIVGFTVAEAKERLPKIRDRKLLRAAVSVASKRPKKETLCRLLYKRLDEIPV